MDKHLELLTKLLIKYYNRGSNNRVGWDQAGEELNSYRIQYRIYDYLKYDYLK